MVEQESSLDAIFKSLSDPTRRDILKRVRRRSHSVSEIALHYGMSLAGVAKHLNVLEEAGLVSKVRVGKERIVSIDPNSLATAARYLESYREVWEQRLDSLGGYLQTIKSKSTKSKK